MGMRLQFRAGGTINMRRIVCINTGATIGDEVIQSTTNLTAPIGVSAELTDQPPLPGNAATQAAVVGESLRCFGVGEVATVELGTGGCTVGDYLKSDTNGKAVTAPIGAGNTTVQYTVGIALETAVAGEAVPLLIMPVPMLSSIT